MLSIMLSITDPGRDLIKIFLVIRDVSLHICVLCIFISSSIVDILCAVSFQIYCLDLHSGSPLEVLHAVFRFIGKIWSICKSITYNRLLTCFLILQMCFSAQTLL